MLLSAASFRCILRYSDKFFHLPLLRHDQTVIDHGVIGQGELWSSKVTNQVVTEPQQLWVGSRDQTVISRPPWVGSATEKTVKLISRVSESHGQAESVNRQEESLTIQTHLPARVKQCRSLYRKGHDQTVTDNSYWSGSHNQVVLVIRQANSPIKQPHRVESPTDHVEANKLPQCSDKPIVKQSLWSSSLRDHPASQPSTVKPIKPRQSHP